MLGFSAGSYYEYKRLVVPYANLNWQLRNELWKAEYKNMMSSVVFEDNGEGMLVVSACMYE